MEKVIFILGFMVIAIGGYVLCWYMFGKALGAAIREWTDKERWKL